MRFDRYPLDQHSCKFMVGSSNYDETRMTFSNLKLHFDQSSANTIVDYQIEIGGKLYTCEEYLTNGINNILIKHLELLVPYCYHFVIDLNEKDKMYRDFSGNYSVTGNLQCSYCNQLT